MNETIPNDYPSFEDAVARFKHFLVAQGWPDQIEWIRLRDILIVRRDPVVRLLQPGQGERHARSTYETAVNRQLGVELFASVQISDRTCAWVYGPADEDESRRLLFPDGLKISVNSDRRSARVIRRMVNWLWYLSFRGRGWAYVP